MKKILLFVLFFLPLCALARQIDENRATIVAKNFLHGNNVLRSNSDYSLKLVHTAASSLLRSSDATENYYYIFDIGNNNGFIIISADDVNVPVIGYSKQGHYKHEDQPANFRSWMKSVKKGMEEAISNRIQQTEDVKQKWEAYLSGNTESIISTHSIEPCIKTQWGQSYPYIQEEINPYYSNQNPFIVTGCGATAMAQVMKYHEHPKSGKKATNAYTTNSYGFYYPSVDLTEYTYDWNNMLDKYDMYSAYTKEQLEAVGILMYHCGISIKMDFGPTSWAASEDMPAALIDYFDYDKDMKFIYRTDALSKQQWSDIMKSSLDKRLPILFGAADYFGSGHLFVCDGYDEMGLFHFNFGWDGAFDGYFDVDSPMGYANTQDIIVNIKPNEGGKGNDYLLSDISALSSVYRNEEFTVNFSVSDLNNPGQNGTYHIALCNEDDKILGIIGTCEPGKSSAVCKADENIYPGYYHIRLLDDTYQLIRKTNGLENIRIAVYQEEAPSYDIRITDETEMTSSIYNGNPGESFTVRLSFANMANSPFDGHYGIVLTNESGFVMYTLYEGNTPTTSDKENTPPFFTFNCKLPDNIPNGYYMLQMATRESEAKPWRLIRGMDSSVKSKLAFDILKDVSSLRKISVQILIANKNYDGTQKLEVGFWGMLDGGIPEPDEDVRVKESSFSAVFSSADAGQNIPVELLAPLELEGEDAYKYTLQQPINLSSSIYPATLIIIADDQTFPAGTDPASLDISNDFITKGFMHNENKSNLSVQPRIAIEESINTETPPGTYPGKVVISDASAKNYLINYINGDLFITSPTDIKTGNLSEFRAKVYPNPVSPGETVNIVLSPDASGNLPEDTTIDIFTPTGIRIKACKADGQFTSINFPETQGVYIVKITYKNGTSKAIQVIVK